MEYIILSLIIALIIEVYYYGQKNTGSRMFTPARNKQLIFIDTSVLIDGRILEVAKTGFMPGVLAVPRSVVGELQFLADNADAEKRFRARHGLDVIQELKQIERIDFMLFQDGSVAKEGVDERLLKLARDNSGVVCTLDFNLNKVAAVEGIEVLNINELAQTLRMAHLPGEMITIDLVQKGQDSHQAVGYLPDGTMVVVENAQQMLGKTKEVEVIRSIQTAAGKMMFARIRGQQDQSRRQKDGHNESKKSFVTKKMLRVPTQRKEKSIATPDNTVAQPSGSRAPDAPRNEPKQRKPQGNKARGGRRRPNDQEDVLLDLVDKQ